MLILAAACAAVNSSAPLYTKPSLEEALKAAILPLLTNLSATHNNSAWSFAYRDANTTAKFCAGYSNVRNEATINYIETQPPLHTAHFLLPFPAFRPSSGLKVQ